MSVNEKMTAIADAIRDKTKETEPLTLDAMATEIPKVFDIGYVTGYNDGNSDGLNQGMELGKQEGRNEGYEMGYEEGKTEGVEEGYNKCLEESDKEIAELIALQEEYIALSINSITFEIVDGNTEELISFTTDATNTWEDIITADLNGAASRLGLQIKDSGYIISNTRAAYVYIKGTDTYCKATDTLINGVVYDYSVMPPDGEEW